MVEVTVTKVALFGACITLAGCDVLLGLDTLTPPPVQPNAPNPISAGDSHTCFVRADHTLFCWGNNESGQLGIDSELDEDDTIAPVNGAMWTAVAAGDFHTCGLQVDHTLWCWGLDIVGELGDGASNIARVSPIQVAGTWTEVALGQFHTCAIAEDGTLSCWGDNTFGELGDGTTTQRSTAVVQPGTWVHVTTGEFHTCAIAADHSISCWGLDEGGQLGDGGDVLSRPTPVQLSSTDTWAAIAAGVVHTCAITDTGHLRCWGTNDSGQLGSDDTQMHPNPIAVLIDGVDPADWVGLTARANHTCAWNEQGQAYCWGDSSRGELTVAGVATNATPVAFAGSWSAIALGNHHTCALALDGKLSCVGAGGWGQLGTGSTSQNAPKMVMQGAWTSIAAGAHTTWLLDRNQHASGGGDNFYGELGLGNFTSIKTATAVATTTQWITIAPGATSVCGLVTGTSALECWGDNGDGQLGLGQGVLHADMPTAVTVPAAAAGIDGLGAYMQTCVLAGPSNEMYCWGPDDHGQLATPPMDSYTYLPSTPVAVSGGAPGIWAQLGTGDGFTCGLASTGKVMCWGRNDENQRGDGTGQAADAYVPAPVMASAVLGLLYVGGSHSCALDAANHAWCWGDNAQGALGVGDTDSHIAAVEISGLTFATLAVGEIHTCGIASTGALYCWGDNSRGQLGNGDATHEAVPEPVQIGSDSDWSAIAAGQYHTCGIRVGGNVYCWGSNDDGALLDGKGWTTQLAQVPVPP